MSRCVRMSGCDWTADWRLCEVSTSCVGLCEGSENDLGPADCETLWHPKAFGPHRAGPGTSTRFSGTSKAWLKLAAGEKAQADVGFSWLCPKHLREQAQVLVAAACCAPAGLMPNTQMLFWQWKGE